MQINYAKFEHNKAGQVNNTFLQSEDIKKWIRVCK